MPVQIKVAALAPLSKKYDTLKVHFSGLNRAKEELKISKSIQDHRGSSGTKHNHTGQYITILEHTGPYRTTGNHKVPEGTIQDHRGLNGTIGDCTGP